MNHSPLHAFGQLEVESENSTKFGDEHDDRKTVMLVFGTRPEAVKMAPLVRAFQQTAWCRVVTVVTAQHREMLDQVLELFDIIADHDLGLLKPGQTLSDVTRRVIEGLDPILEKEAPDLVIVQGDTTTTMSGALAAFHREIPVAHVEAGLRTFDRHSPFPEEMNRKLTSCFADLHLAATSLAALNLHNEGIDPRSIYVTGNTVIDALKWVSDQPLSLAGTQLGSVFSRIPADRRIILVTAHRRESWGDPMVNIGRAIAHLATANEDVHVVFPIHRNPLVRDAVMPSIENLPNVDVIEPLDYRMFCEAMKRAHIILTDSGGVQEEAPSLGVPVLVLRDTTERQEAVDGGTAVLVGTDAQRIVREAQRLLDSDEAWDSMASAANPYGDGKAAERTVAAVAEFFGLGRRLPDYSAPQMMLKDAGEGIQTWPTNDELAPAIRTENHIEVNPTQKVALRATG
jgi:UDP-N-acetylglucosamine 2-epimerase (non-hydrolysing)